MTRTAPALDSFFDGAPDAALVEVVAAKGSTPREKGAWMLVSAGGIFGTIGGGQLEYMAIDKARQLLRGSPSPLRGGSPEGRGGGLKQHREVTPTPALRADPPHKGEGKTVMSIPLGPEIGQCCGGWVELAIRKVDDTVRSDLLAAAAKDDGGRPHVYLFGGGHVGHALARALALLPLQVAVVETRAAELKGLPTEVEAILTAVPEDTVREAPPGAAFLVLTHDHALDFLIVAEALKRDDAAYVGMIGSKSKKATFRSWYLKTAGGDARLFGRLVSPIGGDAVKDKRPSVIAALAAAEVIAALARQQANAADDLPLRAGQRG